MNAFSLFIDACEINDVNEARKHTAKLTNDEVHEGTRRSMVYDAPDVFSYLLERCVVTWEDNDLLVEACSLNCLGHVRTLVEKGAKDNAYSEGLMWAAYHGNREMMELMAPLSDVYAALGRLERMMDRAVADPPESALAGQFVLKDMLLNETLLEQMNDQGAPVDKRRL